MRGRWLGVAAGLALAGCEAAIPAVGVLTPPIAAVTAVSVATSLPQTKKLATDHLLSSYTGRDCSIIHYEKEGEYCVPYPKEIDRSKLVCVKTLGGVECHQRPDPYLGQVQALGSPPPPPFERR